MTRPAAPGAGLRGPGQVVFPDQAKELGRALGLTDDAVVLDRTASDDGGGAREYAYIPRSPVRARLDDIGGGRSGSLVAAMVSEKSTHVITMDGDVPVDTTNRIEINGALWAITSERQTTDQMVTRVEAREIPSS